MEDDDQFVLFVGERLDSLTLLTISTHNAVVDCACPTTVAGETWMRDFLEQLDQETKKMVKTFSSERVFKFGGGKKRVSMGVVIFPCCITDQNVTMKTHGFIQTF